MAEAKTKAEFMSKPPNFNSTPREKDTGRQVRFSYNDASGNWQQKSKRDSSGHRAAKPCGDELSSAPKIEKYLPASF